MKYLINSTIIFGLLILLTTGCEEDYLDRNDPGDLTWNTLYNTKADFEAALAGCYLSITSTTTNNIILGDMPSDNGHVSAYGFSGPLSDIKKLTVNADNSWLNGYWSNNYQTIQRVILLIDKIADADIEENVRKVIVAEAKFLRAYAYFSLVRNFGGVPLYDQRVELDDMYDVPRSSEEQVLDLVISDLNEAMNIDSYRTSEELAIAGGKASTVAAKTLLGKAYMWKRDFTNAETTLADVVNNSGLELVELSELYDPDNPFNKEIIFSINYERTSGFNSPLVNYYPYVLYPNYPGTGGWGWLLIEPYTHQKFAPEDERALQLIDTLSYEYLAIAETSTFTKKYLDINTTFNLLSAANCIVLRYADVLLMYAEALNENGKTDQAYQYINQVRNRAGIGDLPAGYSKAQMFQALADERQKEFIMEGDRWFDLKFRGLDFLKQEMDNYFPNAYYEHYRDLVVLDRHILWPVPEQQRQIKPILEQNDGY